MPMSRLSRLLWPTATGAIAFAGVATVHTDPAPAATRAEAVTYASHVAPIVRAKCETCHRPGSIAPMSLTSYAETQKAAKKIKLRVQARTMPPWHLDRTVGIQEFKNDRSLTDAEIKTISDWVDGGTPMGDPAALPGPATWPDERNWQLTEKLGGPPDLVVKSAPYDVMSRGQDKWWRPLTETNLTEPRWVRAIEIKPSLPGRQVVHHVLTMLEQPEQGVTNIASTAAHLHSNPMQAGLFMEWAVGKAGEIYNEDAGKLLLPGAKIRWEVHYHAIGKAVEDDQVELGVWYYPKGYTPKNRTVLRFFNVAAGSELDIPPGQKTVTQNFYQLQAPARIENFQPHMHMRGRAMMMEAVYPDGRREVLSHVNNFQWNWHVNYIY
ncbi:MAG: hypothetical protein H7066_01155, partial [Cytophagaceae bacterium]|nr:hypothetical protein [Gemmatimonadaceae bacterium]